jgi:hypothetical protein
MSDHKNAIKMLAYSELLVSCQTTRCLNVFDKSMQEPATDLVDVWAEKMSKLAQEAGWRVGPDGLVQCPAHAHHVLSA